MGGGGWAGKGPREEGLGCGMRGRELWMRQQVDSCIEGSAQQKEASSMGDITNLVEAIEM